MKRQQSGPTAPHAGSLIAEVYEAALRPSHWTAVLERLVAKFKGKGAALRTFDATPDTGGFWWIHGINGPGQDQFEPYFSTRNIWQARAQELGLYKSGSIMTSDTLVPQRELRASEFYRTFLRHHDIQDLLAIVLHDGLWFFGAIALLVTSGCFGLAILIQRSMRGRTWTTGATAPGDSGFWWSSSGRNSSSSSSSSWDSGSSSSDFSGGGGDSGGGGSSDSW